GYSFIWPSGKYPYFVRPDGMVTHLKVKRYIPYLIPGMPDCQPQKPRGKLQFCCSMLHTLGTLQALPSDEPVPELLGEGDELPPGDVLSDDDLPTTRRSLKGEANSLYPLLNHKPKNPIVTLAA
ncbi:MAG: hypothetical protein ACKPKO_45565, partial [Candidatus Fonsibacter sp.]